MLRVLVIALSVLALSFALSAGPATAGRPLLVGAAEDASKQPDLPGAVAKMTLAQLAGLRAIRVTAQWVPGRTKLEGGQGVELVNSAAAAQLTGMRLFVAVYPESAKATPRSKAAQAEFAGFAASIASTLLPHGVADFIVGNEPNLNRFWAPQFDANGANAAAPAYLSLLARTYDALKAVAPQIRVIGGALSPRGSDRAGGVRPTHSPTAFVQDLGNAYRRSGRTQPLMDVFAIHPYPESSKLPPTFAHPNSTSISIADYDKLVQLLGNAFDGTPQPGKSLPILYAEFGVQSTTPPDKSDLYSGRASKLAADAVPETMQAQYYRRAFALASCQPNVIGVLMFLVSDQPDLKDWQSGVYYADDTPKSSHAAVRSAADDAAAGRLGACAAKENGGDPKKPPGQEPLASALSGRR